MTNSGVFVLGIVDPSADRVREQACPQVKWDCVLPTLSATISPTYRPLLCSGPAVRLLAGVQRGFYFHRPSGCRLKMPPLSRFQPIDNPDNFSKPRQVSLASTSVQFVR